VICYVLKSMSVMSSDDDDDDDDDADGTDRSSYVLTDPWKSSVSSWGCLCLKLFAVVCPRRTVTGDLRRGCLCLSRVTVNM